MTVNDVPAETLDLAIVTGPHRSGTTFLASVLATADRTVSLGVEPLNVTWGLRGVDQWYPEIREGDHLDALLQALRDGRPARWRAPGERPFDQLASYRRARARNRRLAHALRERQIVIVKDPFLTLSLDYAVGLTSRPVVVAIRHPAAWSMSLRRVGWHPGEFLESVPERSQLVPLAERLGLPARAWCDAPLFEAAAWAWTLLVGAVGAQSSALGDSVLVTPLERFEEQPVETSMSLIDAVGLTSTSESRAAIEALTLGTTAVPADSTTHVLQRDTRASLGAWRSMLASEDRRLIWGIAEPVAGEYYEG